MLGLKDGGRAEIFLTWTPRTEPLTYGLQYNEWEYAPDPVLQLYTQLGLHEDDIKEVRTGRTADTGFDWEKEWDENDRMGMFRHLTSQEKQQCYEEFRDRHVGKTTIQDLTPLRAGLGDEDVIIPKFIGVPLGAPTSPALSTLVLWDTIFRDHKALMYADDGLVYGEGLVEPEQNIYREYGIVFHKGKSGFVKKDGVWLKEFKFLGMIYNGLTDEWGADTRGRPENPVTGRKATLSSKLSLNYARNYLAEVGYRESVNMSLPAIDWGDGIGGAMYTPIPGSPVAGLLGNHFKRPRALANLVARGRDFHETNTLRSYDYDGEYDYYRDILRAFLESSDRVKNAILGRPLIEWSQNRHGNYLGQQRDSGTSSNADSVKMYFKGQYTHSATSQFASPDSQVFDVPVSMKRWVGMEGVNFVSQGSPDSLVVAVAYYPPKGKFHERALEISLEWKDLVESSALGFVMSRAYCGKRNFEEGHMVQNFKFSYCKNSRAWVQEQGVLLERLKEEVGRVNYRAKRLPMGRWIKSDPFRSFRIKHEEDGRLKLAGGEFYHRLQQRFAHADVFRGTSWFRKT